MDFIPINAPIQSTVGGSVGGLIEYHNTYLRAPYALQLQYYIQLGLPKEDGNSL